MGGYARFLFSYRYNDLQTVEFCGHDKFTKAVSFSQRIDSGLAMLDHLDVNFFGQLYSAFFNALWAKGRSLHRVPGKIVYELMAPPCLANSTIFIRGANRYIYPFRSP